MQSLLITQSALQRVLICAELKQVCMGTAQTGSSEATNAQSAMAFATSSNASSVTKVMP